MTQFSNTHDRWITQPGVVSTTNYYNTFIQVAPDCPTDIPEVPPVSAAPTIAALQHRLIMERPYGLTSDDIIFGVAAIRADIPDDDVEAVGTPEYERLASDLQITQKRAMRSSRV